MGPRHSPLLRDVVQTAAAVALVALLLFGGTGVWPPMVAVESGSMEPHVSKGDLVIVAEPGRWSSGDAVVTFQEADDYRRLGARGDVVVYLSPTWDGPPIIHRARFHVDAGENWYARANQSYLPPGVDGCAELRYCPAPHAGYVTKGDANDEYDQAMGLSPPVREEWIRAEAVVKVPWLGWIRLYLTGAA
jgi:signal peptidase